MWNSYVVLVFAWGFSSKFHKIGKKKTRSKKEKLEIYNYNNNNRKYYRNPFSFSFWAFQNPFSV